MNARAQRILKFEIEKHGGELRNVEQGQKHEIATADFGGRIVDFNVSRGERDEHRIRYLVRNTLKREGIQ